MPHSRMWIRAWFVGAVLTLAPVTVAHAQSPHQLIPIIVNKPQHSLPNQFGIPTAFAADDAGDFAFIGLRGTGLYYRKAGSNVITRAIQTGDEVPGLPGSKLNTIFAQILMNANGVVAVRADVFTTNRATHAILTFDGTTVHTLVTGADTAPGTGGAKFERAISLIDLNDAGDVLIGSTLVPLGTSVTPVPTVFKIASGGAVTRIAGPGDASPGTGGTFTGAFGAGLGASGQVLLSATIAGGSGATGLFVSESGVLRKIAATNDSNPVGGTFSQDFTQAAQRINPSGLVVFVANNSMFQNTLADGTTVAVANGSAAPAPMGGTFSVITGLPAVSSSGDAVFFANVTGGFSVSGLFRFRAGTGVEVVARLNETAPGTGGKTYTALTSVSVNASGTVSYQGNLPGFQNGLFQKPAGGSQVLIVVAGDTSPLGGTFFPAGFPTVTLSNGAVISRSHVMDSPVAHHGAFKWFGGATTLMSTNDDLPDGASEIIRPTFLTGAGGFVGVDIMRAGGRETVAYYNPQTQTADAAGTDGEQVGSAANGILQFQTVNTVMVNAAGDVAVQANLFGGGLGPFPRTGIFIGGLTQPLTALAFDGILDDGNRVLNSPQLNNNGVRPISINAAGTVVFTATVSNIRGLWVGSTALSAPKKTAIVGDLVSTGAAITSINAIHGGINEAGTVLFTANTAAGQGLFVVNPGSTPIKVAQVGDAAPGGGTFSGFGAVPSPGFNNVNQVAFEATVAGGTGGGVFLATPDGGGAYTVEAIALNGAASPAGGTYVLNTARPDVVVNDAGHVVFLADVTGGTADSGIFDKRGPAASVVALVVQGQAAPGAPSAFLTFTHGVNGLVEETQQVSATGQVAFFGRSTGPGGSIIVGWWHVETDNSIQPIVVVPSSVAAFDGGTVASTMTISNWMQNDRYPVWAPLVGAPHDGGLYLYAPLSGTATGTGTNVTVTAHDNLTDSSVDVTFANVSSPGVTTLTRSATGPPIPRGWYLTQELAAYYYLTTTATYTGNVTVCVDISTFTPPPHSVLRLLHYESSSWHDVTTSVSSTQMCGTATSLSPFVPVIALNEPTTDVVQNGTFASGAANWQVFATDGTSQDNSYIQWSVNSGVFEYYRVPPPSGSNQAVVLQDIATPFAAGTAIVSHFDIGNSSSVRKRISVLIHAADFSDLSVCTFWIPPNTPMRSYAMRTHTTAAWSAASISFYAASAGDNGGVYQLDNVVMGPGTDLTLGRTDCVDPGEPGLLGSTSGPELLTNGDFSNGLTGWSAVGTSDGRLQVQVTGGVAQFIRPSTPPNTASGVLLQTSNVAIGSGQVVTATFQIGNSSGVRKRITILLHDFTFGDLAACTFWLPPGQPLSWYSMRTYTTQAWSNATISFYPATTDSLGWFEIDNVSLKATQAFQTYGSDCVEPNDESDLSNSPAPESLPAPSLSIPAVITLSDPPPPADVPAWVGFVAVDRRRLIEEK